MIFISVIVGMEMVEKITTIALRISTKKMLDEFGKKNESYDDIIRRLIKKYKEDCKH